MYIAFIYVLTTTFELWAWAATDATFHIIRWHWSRQRWYIRYGKLNGHGATIQGHTMILLYGFQGVRAAFENYICGACGGNNIKIWLLIYVKEYVMFVRLECCITYPKSDRSDRNVRPPSSSAQNHWIVPWCPYLILHSPNYQQSIVLVPCYCPHCRSAWDHRTYHASKRCSHRPKGG